jgi:hypothetical protein
MEDGSGVPGRELATPGFRPLEEGEVELPYADVP